MKSSQWPCHPRTAASPASSSDDNPELLNDHANIDDAGNSETEEHADIDMNEEQIVVIEDGLQVRHSSYLYLIMRITFFEVCSRWTHR